ncbi:MAG: choice-of-anchor A family protein [Candidatus Pristimantibacillus sp.]
MACTNFGTANAYNVFLFGDHTQINATSAGRVAVGGNATYQDYSVGNSLAVSTTDAQLVIAGNVNIVRGSNNGNTIISSTSTVTQYTMQNNNGVPGQPLVDNPIDFAAEQSFLQCTSTGLAAIPANGTVISQFGNLVLNGTDSTLNVFTFDGSNIEGSGQSLSSSNQITFNIPVGSFALVNILGNNIGFGSYSIVVTGADASVAGTRILYNVPQATAFFHQNLIIVGTLFAPFATVTANGSGQIDGQLIAVAYNGGTNSLQERYFAFGGCLPDVCATASLSITKTVQGASSFTGVPGTPITFEINIVNTGSSTLTNIVIEDDLVGFMQTLPNLGPGQSYSNTFEAVVRDGKAGDQYDNVVFARSDQSAEQAAVATVIIDAFPIDVSFSKQVNKVTALPGEEVQYTFLLVNNGNSDLQNVSISDPVLGINQFIGNFFQGQLLTVSFVIPANAVPGSIIDNTSRLIASNLPAPGFLESSAAVQVTETPSLSISKQADLKLARPGDTITYVIRIANDSLVTTLSNIVVTDPLLGLNKTILMLPPDSNVIYTQKLVVPAATPAGETITNTVTAQSTLDVKSATENVQVRANPVLIVDKRADRQFANPGETINYLITLTNAGNIVLSDVVLTDSRTGLSQSITPLAIGEVIEISTSSVIPLDAAEGTLIKNVVTAQSTAIGTVSASASVSVTLIPTPPVPIPAMLAATGFANRSTVSPNELVVFTGNITNISGITVRNITVTSPLFQYVGLIDQLNPGQTFTIQGTFPVANQTTPGTVIRGTLTASSSQTNSVSVEADVVVLAAPDATIKLTVNPEEALQGETVTYVVTINNTGNTILTNTQIRDTLLLRSVLINQFLVASLLMGRVRLAVKSVPGSIVEDTAILTSDQFGPISSSAAFSVYGLNVQLSVNRTNAAVGESLIYRATVSNPSPSEAVNTVLTDLIPPLTAFEPGSLNINGIASQLGNVSGGVPIGTLSPGASSVVQYTVIVKAEPANNVLVAQVFASFFFPATIRQLRGSSPSNRVSVTIEDDEE